MKFLTTLKARNDFPKTLKLAQKELVVVTNHGKPVAAIQGLQSEDDLEDLLLERSPKFWEAIDKARQGKSVSLSQARKKLGIPEK